jgi:hypothetical protein
MNDSLYYFFYWTQKFPDDDTNTNKLNERKEKKRTMSSETEYWIYHEKQQALLCGQHALNNLVQANAFSAGQLAEIAYQLDQMELDYMAQNDEGGRK